MDGDVVEFRFKVRRKGDESSAVVVLVSLYGHRG
jgi:hypothetical protein